MQEATMYETETITIPECRDLRKVIHVLTSAPVIIRKEYGELMEIIAGILERLEKEN